MGVGIESFCCVYLYSCHTTPEPVVGGFFWFAFFSVLVPASMKAIKYRVTLKVKCLAWKIVEIVWATCGCEGLLLLVVVFILLLLLLLLLVLLLIEGDSNLFLSRHCLTGDSRRPIQLMTNYKLRKNVTHSMLRILGLTASPVNISAGKKRRN